MISTRTWVTEDEARNIRRPPSPPPGPGGCGPDDGCSTASGGLASSWALPALAALALMALVLRRRRRR